MPRGRHYLNDADCAAHGVTRADIEALQPTPARLGIELLCAGQTLLSTVASASAVKALMATWLRSSKDMLTEACESLYSHAHALKEKAKQPEKPR